MKPIEHKICRPIEALIDGRRDYENLFDEPQEDEVKQVF